AYDPDPYKRYSAEHTFFLL
nr:RecName: Full=Zinc metalloproteinase partitagin [Hippasa partita]